MKDKIRELTKRNNGWGNEHRVMKLTQFVNLGGEKRNQRGPISGRRITNRFMFIGELDFISTGISGWAALKASSRNEICRTMPRPLVRMANLSA